VWAELGAAWGRQLPIVGLLHGISTQELQEKPGVPILLKKRNLLPLNDAEIYFSQLKERIAAAQLAVQGQP
jgi:hypothetical protein